ncbi:MAG: YacP-like domain protein [Planctomycetaceae bacterium]|nr:YacP-like domain protein [Planctomycetaceae bacterium]
MAATDLLIDGYNLLHAAGYGPARYAPGDLQRARHRLLKKLFQLLTPAEIAQTAVVFDAKEPPPGLPKNWYIHGLRVMYAQPHGDADEMLEQLIEEHAAPRRLTVVSSDHRLHRAAKSRRAVAIDSDDFLEHLERRHPNSEAAELPDPEPTSPKATGETTRFEVDYWMRLFGDVLVSDLADPPQKASRGATAPRAPDSNPESPSKTQQNSGEFKQDRIERAPSRRVKPRHEKKSQPSDVADSEVAADQSVQPSLFSQEWIDELQRWVDGMQGRP